MSSASSLFSVIARGENRAPTVTCHKCHRPFVLGVAGIVTSDGNECDHCANVVRDRAGFAWTSQPKMCMCYHLVGDNPKCVVHGGEG